MFDKDANHGEWRMADVAQMVTGVKVGRLTTSKGGSCESVSSQIPPQPSFTYTSASTNQLTFVCLYASLKSVIISPELSFIVQQLCYLQPANDYRKLVIPVFDFLLGP